jgi:hypothetical protein
MQKVVTFVLVTTCEYDLYVIIMTHNYNKILSGNVYFNQSVLHLKGLNCKQTVN